MGHVPLLWPCIVKNFCFGPAATGSAVQVLLLLALAVFAPLGLLHERSVRCLADKRVLVNEQHGAVGFRDQGESFSNPFHGVFFDCLDDLRGGKPFPCAPPCHDIFNSECAVPVDMQSSGQCAWITDKVNKLS